MKFFFKPKANEMIMSLYLLLISVALTDVFITDRLLPLLCINVILFIVFLYLSHRFLPALGRLELHPDDIDELSTRKGLRIFAIFSLISLAIYLVWYLAYFPGSFGYDALSQYGQAVSGELNDWHPYWHTLVFYMLPLKLSGGRVWFIVLFQIILFSLTVGYICLVIYRHAGFKLTIITFLYILLNPVIGYIVICPFKDVPFAMAGGIAMAMAADIYFTQGEWSHIPVRCILLGFMLANASILRHNGILFAGFLLLALILFMRRRDWVIMAVSFAVVMFIVNVPVNRALDVEHTPQTTTQAVGLPMSVIQAAVVETPERLDGDILDFAYELAPRTEWEEYYECGNFGLMKYYSDMDESVIDETGVFRIIGMSLKCIAESPGPSFRAVFSLTDIVYGIDLPDEGYNGYGTPDNSYGITTRTDNLAARALLVYYKLVRLHGYNFTRQTAFVLLILIAVLLSRCMVSNWRLILLIAPVLTYNFGTMLLLTSATVRFFFISYLICPVGVALLLRNQGYEG